MFEGEIVHGQQLIRRLRSGQTIERDEDEAWRNNITDRLRKLGLNNELKIYEQIYDEWMAAIRRVGETGIARTDESIRQREYLDLAADAYDRIVKLLSGIP